MTTMRDVAARAGVSAKTVSRALRGDKYVTDAVRERVLAAVDELGYVPNMLAVSFRTGRDAAIGVAVPDLADPFFAEAVQAIETVARGRHTAVIVSSLGYDPDHEPQALEPLLHRQLIGLIACPVGHDQSYLKPWQARMPMVFIDREPRRLVADMVLQNDADGARQATEHLLATGHRRIAFIGDDPAIATITHRLEGYRQALTEHGIPVQEDLVVYDEADGPALASKLAGLRTLADPPTALFCSNARTALIALPDLDDLGWRGVAVVSFGDFPMAGLLTPPVCAIDQDPRELGRLAATRLFDRIDRPGRRLKRRIVMPVTLIDRGGCHA